MPIRSYRFFCPTRYAFLRRRFGKEPFRALDVGCGHSSLEVFRHYFPRATYHGLDKRLQGDLAQYDRMDRFFDVNLDDADFSALEDGYYDAIVFSHTIEHLFHGHQVLEELSRKLKVGGCLYVEFPSERSLRLPSAAGTLNFFDDPTHVRMYSIAEIANTLLERDVRVLRVGTARNWWRMLAVTPLAFVYSAYHLARYGKISSRGWFDVSGFASYVLGEKHKYSPDVRKGSWEDTQRAYQRRKKKRAPAPAEAPLPN